MACHLNLAMMKIKNASYDFFKALGDLIYTGPTGTNVSDLRLILAYKE